MQSDERSARALAALAHPRDNFRNALVEAIGQLTAFIQEQRAPIHRRAAQEAARLGDFAAGHFDVERFNAIIDARDTLDAPRVDRLEHALQVLADFASQGDAMFQVRVQPGVDVRDTVRGVLAARGRVFNTAQHAELVRSGSAARATFDARAFRQWSRLEKSIAPPLILTVNGADLQLAGLAEYMDGAQKIVLVIEGAAAPAPLVRLIAPRTFVLQTTDATELSRLAEYDGPGIAALLPDGCARFCHDPARGTTLAQRLDVSFLPEPPRRGVAGGSLRQQAEELEWLAELARLGRSASTASPPAEIPAAPADQLAAWLLQQAGSEP